MSEIDWSPISEATCYCVCGVEYRSKAKVVKGDDGQLRMQAQRPCPGCGHQDRLRRVSHDPETWRING